MSARRVRKPSKFLIYIRSPLRVLARARDLYVQSLTGCGGNITYGNSMGCPTPQIPKCPRSFSVNASNPNLITAEEELRELIRLASTRGVAGKVEPGLRRSKTSVEPVGRGGTAPVPRSNTLVVGFGRIDENKPFDFEEEDDVGLLGGVYPRSRSHALARRINLA